MRPKHLALPAMVLVSAFAAAPVLAGSVGGVVTDTSGNAVDKVVVQLEPQDPKQMTLTTKSKKKGNFVFGLVREGTYRIRVKAEGYRVSAIRVMGVGPEGEEVIPLTEGKIAPGQEMPELPVGELDKITLDLTLTPSSGGGGEQGTGVAVMGAGELARLIGAGEYAEARAEIERGLGETPDDAQLFYMKAYLELENEQLEDALSSVQRAIDLEPSLAGSRLLKGVILQRRGEDERALAEFQAELATGTEEPQIVHDSWVHMAMVARNLERWDLAREALTKLVEMDPNDAVAYSQLLELAIRQGKGDEAERILAEAPAELRNDPVTHYNLGVQHWNVGDAEGAARAYERALELAPDMADALRQLGFAEANLGQTARAIEHLKHYLKLAPDAPDAEGLRKYVEELESQLQNP